MKLQLLAVDVPSGFSDREISAWLRRGFMTIRVETMEEAIVLLQRRSYEVTAINADNIDYKAVLAEMRKTTSSIIVIGTSSFCADEQTEAIRLGANYYMKFRADEDSTVDAILTIVNRYNEYLANTTLHQSVLVQGKLIVSGITRKVFIFETEIRLTAKEFDILQMLMAHPGRVFTHGQIFEKIWGESEAYGSKYNVWTTIHRLRHKLKSHHEVSGYIKTVRDIGYSFDPDSD